MRASKEHMDKIRAHILESSGQGFREEGYQGLGINALAKRAGMTSGAFYGHFPSKSQAFHEVVEKGMCDYKDSVAQFKNLYQDDWPKHFLDFYLSQEHLSDVANSCVVPALSCDVMRADDQTKAVYSALLEQIATQISHSTPERGKAGALALISLLAGSIMIARSVDSQRLQQEILQSARQQADLLIAG